MFSYYLRVVAALLMARTDEQFAKENEVAISKQKGEVMEIESANLKSYSLLNVTMQSI